MKNLFVLCCLLLLAIVGKAQATKSNHLIGPTWLLTEEIVTGKGNAPATNKDIHLDFFTNDTWQSSQPLLGATSGKWVAENNGKLLLNVANKKMVAITATTSTYFAMEWTSKGTTIHWKWEAAQ